MNKYQSVISNLSIEEKLKLITSNKYIENAQIKDYVVPNLRVDFGFKDKIDNFINPSIKSMGALYDTNLIENYGYQIGKYLSFKNFDRIINVTVNPIQDNNSAFSSSRLVTAKMAAALVKGMERGGFLASYGIIPSLKGIDLNSYYNDDLYSFKVAFSIYKPFACVLDSPDALDILIDDYNYEGLKIVINHNQNELINSINHNVELSIVDGFTIDYNALLEATNKYNIEKNKLAKGEISTNDFRNMLVKSLILNPEAIDIALCSLLEKLIKMDNHFKQKIEYAPVILETFEYEIAKQSVVLLKNDNILPLAREKTFAFIGDALFKPNLNTSNNEQELDVESIIDSYHLETKGIAHGDINGIESNDDLLVKAERLAEYAEYSIVFLHAVDGAIPENEIRLLKRLMSVENTTIIPVLMANSFVDLSFLTQFKALIMNFSDSKSCIKAALDVIVGRFNPTARLPFAIKSNVEDIDFKVEDNLIYPMGHGLSYSKFNYKSITINENGIVLAVTNESKISGTDTLFLVTKYLDGDIDEYNYIRDFITVDLEGHESKLVEFNYNFNSFAIYDVPKNERLIRGGEYKVQLMTEFNNELKSNIIQLDRISKENISSANLQESYDNYKESFDALSYDIKAPKNYIPNPLKYIVLAVINVYIFLLAFYLAYSSTEMYSRIIPFVVFGIVLIVSILIIINSIHRSKSTSKVEDLTSMVNDVKEFDVSIHQTFEEPIPVIEEEEIPVEEEIVEEEPEVIQKQFIFYDAYGEQIIDNLEYSNYDTFEEMVDRYKKYALSRGVMIESVYVKQLMAAILSSNLVIISGKSKEKNIEALIALNEFFGNEGDFLVDLEGKEKINIYWDMADDNINYSLSSFANNLIRAAKLPKRFNIVGFSGVNNESIKNIEEFVEFGGTPLEKHNINIGDEYNVEIASNTVVVLFVDETIDNDLLYKNSLSLDLVTSNNTVESEEVILKYNDYQYIKTMIEQARNKNYISEDIWRKIDTIFENQIFNGFKLNNKDFTVFEKLAGILIDLKFDEIQALNYAFIMRLIPILLTLEKNASPSFRGDVIDIFDNVLEDRAEATIKAYRNS